jgi:hypothetical protein
MTPNRLTGRVTTLAIAGTLLVMAASTAATARPKPGVDEPVGTWAFDTTRPIKAVVAGGSIAAFVGAGFGDQLQGACRNLEVVNIAKARYSAWAVMKRFEAQVLRNANVDPKRQETWAFVLGGLNSVGNPEKTNADVLALYRMAHDAGFKVVGLSLSPWGTESDTKRWAGFAGVGRQDNTRKAVDFVMGRLTPAEALGRYAEGRTAWRPGDLPDVAVDLYDSPLRDRDAALRPAGPLEATVDADPLVSKRLAAVPDHQRKSERKRLIEQARALPRWYLRPDLHSFDSIHPNKEGHRIIAAQICRKAPASWGCDCSLLEAEGGKP